MALILAVPLHLSGEAQAVVNLYSRERGPVPLEIATAQNVVANASTMTRRFTN